jgi:chemotaxis protein MotB
MRQIMLVVLVAALAGSGCTGKYKTQISDQETEIAQLQQKVKELQSQVDEEQQRAEELSAELAKALSDYRAKEQVWLEQKDNKSIVSVSDAVLFGSGSADLSGEGTGLVDKIVGVVQKYPDRAIMIEGHTDNVPIGPNIKDKYQSNWELSSARACSVLRYMYWKHKVDPESLSAVGYGEYRPVATNDTAEGRAKNRRVVIVIGPTEQSMAQSK